MILPESNSIRPILNNAIIKMGKTLALIGTLHSRKAFSFIKDGMKVIMQVFTPIELAQALGQSTEI